MHAWQWEKELKSQWVVIIIIIPFEVKDINIFRVFLWGWRGKRRRRGLSPEGSPLCRALQGKYDDYILKTFKNPKSWFFMTWISWLVFIAWNLCFTVFWLVLMALHFCELYFKKKCIRNNKKCNEGGFRVNRITSFEKCAQNHSKWPAHSSQALPPSPLPGVARGRL